MSRTTGGPVVDGTPWLDTNRRWAIRARILRVAGLGRTVRAVVRKMMRPGDALLEGINCIELNPRLPAPVPGSAFGLHHTQSAFRVFETGLLCLIAQRLQQPGAPLA